MDPSQAELPQNADLSDPLLTTATCNQCKRQIKPGEYRVVVVAAELGTVPYKVDSSRIGGRRRFLAFCARCSFGIVGHLDGEGEYVLRHPLVRVFFGSTRKQISQDIAFEKSVYASLSGMAEEGKLEDAGRQARENELIAAVRRADDNATDVPRPQTTVTKDALQLLANYLLSPEVSVLKSWQRRAGELCSQGKKQVEIESEVGKDQTTVSRVLRDLKAKAHVWAQQQEALKAKAAVVIVDKQLNALFPSYPRYNDVMAHASLAGASIERSTGDDRIQSGGVRPDGAGPDAFEQMHEKPVDPRR